METLRLYAPGDGCLAFCWEDGKGNATAPRVTVEDATNYLLNETRAKHLRDNGWGVWANSGRGEPVLVGPVKRIDATTLLVDGKPYEYGIDTTNIFYRRDGDIVNHALTVTYKHDGEAHNVANVNIRSGILFFLNHEKGLTDNPPTQGLYNLADFPGLPPSSPETYPIT